MKIVHGTWIPAEAADFIQQGGFYLWVETDAPTDPSTAAAPARTVSNAPARATRAAVADVAVTAAKTTTTAARKRRAAGASDLERGPDLHPRSLTREALAVFLDEALGIHDDATGAVARDIEPRYVLLPSGAGAGGVSGPLPSFELLRYVDDTLPAQVELRSWQVHCYRLRRPLLSLNDLHFAALHAAEEFQLGADLLFWHGYSQALRAVIARDDYIPALTYRSLSVEPTESETTGKKGAKAKGKKAARFEFEIYHGWQFISDRYDATLRSYLAALPAACRAGAETRHPDGSGLYDGETLLRHFAECQLYDTVTETPLTAKLDGQLAGTILYDCMYPYKPALRSASPYAYFSVGPPRTRDQQLDEYRQWAGWRDRLARARTAAGSALCLRLIDAPADDTDNWQLRFMAASKQDPSLKLDLADYWRLYQQARAEALRGMGQDARDFEKDLLLALGYAARIYPKMWDGLETAEPVGLRLSLEEAFAFLRESAWVLEDAGYTVIVPAWWTPQGRRRARMRLKTTAGTGAGAGSAAGPSRLGMETLVSYQYQLSIDGQPVSEEEWRQLVEAKTPLVQFRGEWMQLDRARMEQMLRFWQERKQDEPALTLLDLMRLDTELGDDLEWDHDAAMRDMMDRLQDKSALIAVPDPPNLNGTLREYQRRGVAWLGYLESLGLNPCLADDMGLGKCMCHSTYIVVNGDIFTAGSLWNTYASNAEFDGEGFWTQPTSPLLVSSLDQQSNKMRLAPVRRLYRQHVHETLRKVTLEDGSSVTATRRHRFLTNDGWSNDLKVGDYACVPATLPWDGTPQDSDLMTFLAWQIAEGNELSNEARLAVTQKDPTVLENLRQTILRVGERYGIKVNHPAVRMTAKGYHILTVSSREYQQFLEARGYAWGKHSKDKAIPPLVMQADLAGIRLFLRNYFDAEASVVRSMRSIEIASASPHLIQQLSLLLRRFGVWLRVSCKMKRATNGSGIFRPYYIGVIGGNSARRFLQDIGFGLAYKQQRLENLCAYTANTNVEGIPTSCAVAAIVRATGLPLRHFGMHSTVYTDGSQQFSRASVERVVAACDHIISGESERAYRQLAPSKWTAHTLERYARLDMPVVVKARESMQHLLDQEVFYCRITSIDDVEYEGWVYDVEVQTHHNFVANNVLCHNTVQVIAHLLKDTDQDAATPMAMAPVDGPAAEHVAVIDSASDAPAAAAPAPTLLIAPTSVLGNWRKEIERFAPDLRAVIHHGPGRLTKEADFKAQARGCDVLITSFALARLDERLLRSVEWRRVVVDEAQNIKNPQSAQAKAIGKIQARHRVALTGTPVENRLRDLWSLFNFLNPGYLGKEAQFRKAFETPIQKDNDQQRAATLKRLVEPFILRRLKTDKRIIDDLPDKVEQKVYCNLTPEQASLYQAVVKDVETQLDEAEGIGRKGLMLATLMRLKQICNHPAQFLQDGSPFTPERSHKLSRLAAMIEEVIEGGESLLIFTQFTEIGDALERFIAHTLHYNTYYLHGGTSMRRREEMVAQFQNPETEPAVFILSLRAGGTGITLTKANHVFHFDRWWNPAVEDQATDRAFRIGQRNNVFVHKFVAMGTMEERIDGLIEDKKRLSSAIVGGDESWLTELDNETFKELIALQRSAVME